MVDKKFNENMIRCYIRIKRVFYPKDGKEVEPGGFATFSAEVVKVKQGNPIMSRYSDLRLKGNVPSLDMNKTYSFCGEYVHHEKFGDQYKIIYMNEFQEITDPEEQKSFLHYILTDHQFEMLYEAFENPYEIIKNGDIKSLCTVSGITEGRAQKIIDAYENNIDNSEAYTKLIEYGLTPSAIEKLVRQYHGADILVKKIEENPYVLIDDAYGIGWKKADALALNMGLKHNSQFRIEAYVMHFLAARAEEGNSIIPANQTINSCIKELELDEGDQEVIKRALFHLHDVRETLWWSDDRQEFALTRVWNLEDSIAKEIKRLADAPVELIGRNMDAAINEAENALGIEYTEEQRDAIKKVCSSNVCILTGYGGCLDAEMEFFNGVQWKKIKDYVKGDKVLQYNENGTTTLVEPEKYVKFKCEYLYHMKNKSGSINQLLSAEHNVVYLTSKNNLAKIPMWELYQRNVKRKSGFNGHFITTFNYDGPGIDLSDADIRLMCAVICDGSFLKDHKSAWCRVNVKKERKKLRMRRLLSESGRYFDEHQWNPKDLEYSNFVFYAPRKEKRFTSYWYNCNHHQLEVICDEILNWDGHVKEGRRKDFSTLIKETADFIQFAFSSCGYRSVVYESNIERHGKMVKEYNVHIVQHSNGKVSLMTKGSKSDIDIVRSSDGYKYCFTVPSHMFLTRYNGRICVTGNTGKSTVVAGVLKVLRGKSFAQTALSGRAAARMQEITGQDGKTIHRLLGYDIENGGFVHDKDNPLDEDIIILDETSMVGAQLFYDLIQAIETGKRFIMIGDDGQLESIGMCNIFKDMLASKVVPVARLTKIHRQAAKSAIITESIKVRNATQLVPYGWAGSEIRGELRDLELDIYKDASESFNHIINQYRTLYNKVGNDSAKIQIVLPQKLRGSICTYEVNNAIQEIVNPSRGQAEAKVTIYGDGKDRVYTLREGDQVIINKNNYELHTYNLKTKKKEEKCPVFNGNRGIIRKIESSFILVDFDQWGTIFIPHYFGGNNIWATLELAYALSCHKLQGSEAPYVIVGMDNSAYLMLTREWLYTAITRAKKYCVICAETHALDRAVKTSRVPYKRTFLMEFLRKEFSEKH